MALSLALHSLAVILLLLATLRHDSLSPAAGMTVISIELVPSTELQQSQGAPHPTAEQKPAVIPNGKKSEVKKPEKQASVAATAPISDEDGPIASGSGNNNGPKIIYQPSPKIPDDLRREAFSTYALARFHVAADGSATVELTSPSQNPRLNRILLETLKTWKFAPATQNGNPVAATFDIRVHFTVE